MTTTTLIPPTKPTETAIELSDILDARTWYNPQTLQELLSIPIGAALGAQRQFKGAIFAEYRGHDRTAMLGRQIIAWIEREGIEWRPTTWAIACHERKIRASVLPTRTADLLDLARERIAERQREAEAAAAAEQDSAIGRYVSVLRRFDAPKKSDADGLAELLERLSLPDRRVRDDREIIRKIDRLAVRLAATRLEPDRQRIVKSACDVAARAGWLFRPINRGTFPEFQGGE